MIPNTSINSQNTSASINRMPSMIRPAQPSNYAGPYADMDPRENLATKLANLKDLTKAGASVEEEEKPCTCPKHPQASGTQFNEPRSNGPEVQDVQPDQGAASPVVMTPPTDGEKDGSSDYFNAQKKKPKPESKALLPVDLGRQGNDRQNERSDHPPDQRPAHQQWEDGFEAGFEMAKSQAQEIVGAAAMMALQPAAAPAAHAALYQQGGALSMVDPLDLSQGYAPSYTPSYAGPTPPIQSDPRLPLHGDRAASAMVPPASGAAIPDTPTDASQSYPGSHVNAGHGRLCSAIPLMTQNLLAQRYHHGARPATPSAGMPEPGSANTGPPMVPRLEDLVARSGLMFERRFPTAGVALHCGRADVFDCNMPDNFTQNAADVIYADRDILSRSSSYFASRCFRSPSMDGLIHVHMPPGFSTSLMKAYLIYLSGVGYRRIGATNVFRFDLAAVALACKVGNLQFRMAAFQQFRQAVLAASSETLLDVIELLVSTYENDFFETRIMRTYALSVTAERSEDILGNAESRMMLSEYNHRPLADLTSMLAGTYIGRI